MKTKIKRNLSTKENRKFWATVDKLAKEATGKELKLDPYTDMYSDLSPELLK